MIPLLLFQEELNGSNNDTGIDVNDVSTADESNTSNNTTEEETNTSTNE